MKKGVVFYIVGMNTAIIGLSMLFPAAWSFYYKTPDLKALLVSSFITTIIGFMMFFFLKPPETEKDIRYKEGFAIVTFTWAIASFFGSLPFIFSGTLPNFADAYFETMSGFTTTGASVLTEIEGVYPGILFWRSLTHWLVGMGIVVLFIAILASLGSGGMQIYKAEYSGPSDDKIRPRLSETAKILWFTYLLLTLFEVLLLLAGGMTFYDSLCHTFGTLATGGFSTKNLSIGHYDNLYIHWVITLFMLLSGVNFSLYYVFYKHKSIKIFFKDEEFKLYTTILFAATAITTFVLFKNSPDTGFLKSLTDGAFQVVSIMTTTGFATVNFDAWPDILKLILLGLMFIGGCAGSTGGAIKVGRILVLLKQSSQELKKIIHPKIVTKTKICNKVIEDKQVLNILQFFFIFIVIFMVSTIILARNNVDFITAMSASAATLTNVGPGFNLVGPLGNYSFFGSFDKLYMSFLMLLGRLELYTVLVLFNPLFLKN